MATGDPERRSCFDVAVAVALFHFLLLALGSSIPLHNTTVTVIIVQFRASSASPSWVSVPAKTIQDATPQAEERVSATLYAVDK
ncbi:hypothetical protein TRIATDRAFT_306340 [Trichoderma atroviride IMI 206040]|uniref:Uncharacterized protein n=1 Tax=Hypocrea atroviridis (strain ATCC 20476 / IMI 206040) TaxID=452589 RepID=G9NNH5_HYPAI|nr:uncharacterized protein TRIATDRAFT_306340 [Trichoderma atroviride IMI 206040]EHK47620.1 hypothetical protein TRIATDRAFT_306340 [Trichoderma atroviride IMI 206040]